jgi:hypothetical protein
MDIQKQLFIRPSIYLGPIDHENDPPVISGWSHDPEYLSLVEIKAIYPHSVGRVQKKLEALEKQMDSRFKNLDGRMDSRFKDFEERVDSILRTTKSLKSPGETGTD